MRADYNCWKCGQDPKSKLKFTDPAVLRGGWCARLCIACRNLWHEYVVATPQYDEYVKLEAEYDIAIRDVESKGVAVEINKKIAALNQKFYALGKAWVPEPITEEATKS